jgi:hydroxymethylpyrimidine/phosphomethylpyrimidine kinase
LSERVCVLVFAGADPSGGAGIAADIQAITALGAHALPVITALTVQDNNRVHRVVPVAAALVLEQARALLATVTISAVKIGIPGSAETAAAIAGFIAELRAVARATAGPVPVVVDPVLRSGHGDALGHDDAVAALAPLLPLATVVTPNGIEAAALAAGAAPPHAQALRALGCEHVLITGGHDNDPGRVTNRWLGPDQQQDWTWPRLPGSFHGSGCTLASAIAALLAQGVRMQQALAQAQAYTHTALASSYAIAPGQRIPQRRNH